MQNSNQPPGPSSPAKKSKVKIQKSKWEIQTFSFTFIGHHQCPHWFSQVPIGIPIGIPIAFPCSPPLSLLISTDPYRYPHGSPSVSLQVITGKGQKSKVKMQNSNQPYWPPTSKKVESQNSKVKMRKRNSNRCHWSPIGKKSKVKRQHVKF